MMDSNIPDILLLLDPVTMHSAFIPIRENIKPVHYCKIIDKAKKVKEGEAIEICFTGILKGMCTKSLFSSQLVGKKPR